MTSIVPTPTDPSILLLREANAMVKAQENGKMDKEYKKLTAKFRKKENQKALATALAGNYLQYPEYKETFFKFSLMTHRIMWKLDNHVTFREPKDKAVTQAKPHVIFKESNSFAIRITESDNTAYVIVEGIYGVISLTDVKLVETSGVVNSMAIKMILNLREQEYENMMTRNISEVVPIYLPLCQLVSSYCGKFLDD